MTHEPASLTASQSPKRGKKYFTLDEANRALKYVAPIVSDITGSYKAALDLRDRLQHPQPDDSQDVLQTEYERAMDRLDTLMEELRQVGVELKDFEKGLLDFPSIHEGREILLCWHTGEPQVKAWHEVDAGYAGRQDVAVLEKN